MSDHVFNVKVHNEKELIEIWPTTFSVTNTGNLRIHQEKPEWITDVVIGSDSVWGIIEWLKESFKEKLV